MNNRAVFIVEDDEHVAALVRFVLEREGFEVTHAGDGGVAAQHIDTMPPPDVVLLDVMLPQVSGFELIARIRAREEWSEVPILMLTSQSTSQNVVRALDAGANDYVTKPFRPEELIARIRRFVR